MPRTTYLHILRNEHLTFPCTCVCLGTTGTSLPLSTGGKRSTVRTSRTCPRKPVEGKRCPFRVDISGIPRTDLDLRVLSRVDYQTPPGPTGTVGVRGGRGLTLRPSVRESESQETGVSHPRRSFPLCTEMTTTFKVFSWVSGQDALSWCTVDTLNTPRRSLRRR